MVRVTVVPPGTAPGEPVGRYVAAPRPPVAGWRPTTILGAPAPGGLLLPPAHPTASWMYGPRAVWVGDDLVVAADTGNHRVLLWRGLPEPGADGTPADVVLGQPDEVSEGPAAGGRGPANGLYLPTGVLVDGERLVVADAWHHRILVWHRIPTVTATPPDLVLGQPDATSVEPNMGGTPTAGTFYWPFGIALVGGRFHVADTGNRRVLVWNDGIPEPGRPADVVLGQPDPAAREENRGGPVAADSFRWPHAFAGDGAGGLWVADAGNHRLLSWSRPPEGDGPADRVLGQADFATGTEFPYVPQAGRLRFPYGVAGLDGALAIADTANNRVLLQAPLAHDSADSAGGTSGAAGAGGPGEGGVVPLEPVAALGQPDTTANGENRWEAVAADTLCWPYGLHWHRGDPAAGGARGDRGRRLRQQSGRVLGAGVTAAAPAQAGAPHSDEPRQAAAQQGAPVVRRRFIVRGIVQGVGFRPHLARLAADLGLTGSCHNDATGVSVDAEGPATAVAAFAERLLADAPPLARIDELTSDDVPPLGDEEFRIVSSGEGSGPRTLVPPDTAVCADCLAELADPGDRRHRHPFITCTNCGPRLTITVDLPYDRPNTSLAAFPLCPACAAEYADPLDRRYHAQPIGCHDCGPTLWFTPTPTPTRDGEPVGGEAGEAVRREDALAAAVDLLATGRILAVKGLGGYHLACDATDPAAVARLRARKQRPDRPFALLVADLQTAGAIVQLDGGPTGEPATLLASPRRPIVLLPALHAIAPPPTTPLRVADGVAPGLDELGVMLAYAPVHHLLLGDLERRTGRPAILVMTSGNAAGEPLTYRDADAPAALGGIADGILGHDRPIVVPVEDGVVAWSAATGAVPVRRSRGDAPLPVDLPRPASNEGTDPARSADTDSDADSDRDMRAQPPATVLAAGAELKNTVALACAGRAFVSAHVGDLESLPAQAAHQAVTDQLLRFHRSAPTLLVADLHPGYASRAWARRYATELGVPVLDVQHHHAHLAALAAEHGRLDEPLLGVVFDGTGYGCDGGVWGGELLLLRDGGIRADRLGRLGDVRLPGGDAGVRHPVRTAALALLDAGVPLDGTPVADELTASERSFLTRAHTTGFGAVATSSVGRLYDVVASLLGVCHRVSYEAQAAIELEAVARRWRRTHPGADPVALAMPVRPPSAPDVPAVLDPTPLLRDLAAARADGVDPGDLAAAFHDALAVGAAELAAGTAAACGARTVGLTGGVYVNRLLLAATTAALRGHGLAVLTHRVVPANDGGLALGQVAVGARYLADWTDPNTASATEPSTTEPSATEPSTTDPTRPEEKDPCA